MKKTILTAVFSAIIWAIHIAAQTKTYIFAPPGPLPWVPFLYNYTAIIVVFYTIYIIASTWARAVSLNEAAQYPCLRALWYITGRWQLLAVWAVKWVYITGSWYVDTWFEANGYLAYKAPSFWMYTDTRGARIDGYIAFAALLAVAAVIYKRMRIKLGLKAGQNKWQRNRLHEMGSNPDD